PPMMLREQPATPAPRTEEPHFSFAVATSAERQPNRIVVVGGGAGGLELVTRLGDRLGHRGLAHVTLIDSSRTHLWKPLLHEAAAGTLGIDDQALDYIAQAHWHHFDFRLGTMEGLDRERREVIVAPSHSEEDEEV